MNPIEEEVQTSEGMKFAEYVTNQYALRIEDSDTFGPCLALTPGGFARIATICGWLCGLADAGKEDVANAVADVFFKEIHRLGHWADLEPDTVHFRVPKARVLLGDDGSRHGFSILWYVRITREQALACEAKHRIRWFRSVGTGPGVLRSEVGEAQTWGMIPYAFNFNGGLLWHGPRDNSLAVNLCGGNLWSIHT